MYYVLMTVVLVGIIAVSMSLGYSMAEDKIMRVMRAVMKKVEEEMEAMPLPSKKMSKVEQVEALVKSKSVGAKLDTLHEIFSRMR